MEITGVGFLLSAVYIGIVILGVYLMNKTKHFRKGWVLVCIGFALFVVSPIKFTQKQEAMQEVMKYDQETQRVGTITKNVVDKYDPVNSNKEGE